MKIIIFIFFVLSLFVSPSNGHEMNQIGWCRSFPACDAACYDECNELVFDESKEKHMALIKCALKACGDDFECCRHFQERISLDLCFIGNSSFVHKCISK